MGTRYDDATGMLVGDEEHEKVQDEQDDKIATLEGQVAELLAACEEFVRKVECGEARSRRSYAKMKAAIVRVKGEPN